MTYTYAELEVSPAAYDEVAGKLRAAQYEHSFMDDGTIDMHGIGLTRGPKRDWLGKVLSTLFGVMVGLLALGFTAWVHGR